MTAALAFLAVAALLIVTPGQDTALTVRSTLTRGRRGGVLTAAGVSTGQAVWALATSAGLAALVVASDPVFTALRVAGGAYLVLLGVEALVAAARGRLLRARRSRVRRAIDAATGFLLIGLGARYAAARSAFGRAGVSL